VLSSIEANMRTEALLKQSQGLTQELQSQQEELRETNQRLEQQARSLRESEDLLRRQQEELRETNTELEEKAVQLADQNAEVERKNREIEHARKAIEEKAEQLALTSKYKSEFLANMSHELRTPLNSMLILSRMLSENPEEHAQPEAGRVRRDHLLLRLGSARSHQRDPRPLARSSPARWGWTSSRSSIGPLAYDLDRTFREVANERNIEYEIVLEEGLPDELETDRKRLQQVLKNLLANAFKFTHEGSVELRITPATGVQFRTEHLRTADTVIAFSRWTRGSASPRRSTR
jgi:signal transduction histidine kinase